MTPEGQGTSADLVQYLPVLLGCLSNPRESWTVPKSCILQSLKPSGIQRAIHLILKQTSVVNLIALYTSLTVLRSRDFFIQISRCRYLVLFGMRQYLAVLPEGHGYSAGPMSHLSDLCRCPRYLRTFQLYCLLDNESQWKDGPRRMILRPSRTY